MKKITKKMVDDVQWSDDDLADGYGESLVGCQVDSNGSVFYYNEEGNLRSLLINVPKWRE
jgi:hypothetical protein